MDNKETEVINDIIRIHKDRSDGYNRAIKELRSEDEDLKTIFIGMAQQSVNFNSVLIELESLSGESKNLPGPVYNTWVSIKVKFGGQNRQSILESCKIGEEAVMKAYESALNSEGLSLTTKSILESQQTELRAANSHIKELRGSIVDPLPDSQILRRT